MIMQNKACLGVFVVIVGLMMTACSTRQRSKTDPAAARTPASAHPQPAPTIAPSVKGPLSAEEIAELRRRVDECHDDYPARIEARRALLAELRNRGPAEQVLSELRGLLTDIEQEEGREMLHRAAIAEAGTWQADKDFLAAASAYEHIIEAYPDSPFADEAMYQLGNCKLDLHEYAEAEATFQRMIDVHSGSPLVGWGWRKLALAQLLQGDFDRSLATLDRMASNFGDGEFAEYARARKGYVQMAAGRKEDAQASYDAFLSACPTSKYCRLVQQQIAMLDQPTVIVSGSGPQ
jgi:TolA-binding protein